MIIDAHNHPDWCGYELKAFLANMAERHIDKTWLLSWECPRDEYHPSYDERVPSLFPDGPIPFTRCISYAERAPEKFILGYAPDPRRAGAIDRMNAAMTIYGARVCGELKLRMMFDNLDAIRLYRFCGEKKAPVVVHIDYDFDEPNARYPRSNYWYGGGIDPFERAVNACPDTTFLGHGPGFWANISGDENAETVAYPTGKVLPGGKLVTMLRKYPNLYCDLSAGSGCSSLQRDLDHARKFLVEFQDRICYARDYFDNQHQEVLNSLGLPKEVLEKIYSGNALKLVPLK